MTAGPAEPAGPTAPAAATDGRVDPGRLDAVLQTALDGAGVRYEHPFPGHFLVRLEGEHKQATLCWLIVGAHALLVEAFVMRHPEENRDKLWDLLLTRNARMFAVSWSIDVNGDVYLVGRLPLAVVTPDEVDRILGAVLDYADSTFDTMLEIGYGTAIRREWAWRVKAGESTANLRAFARFADPATTPPATTATTAPATPGGGA